MSSNCPPQLHLSLPQNTTSFKRSFEEFGFDLESPSGSIDTGGGGPSSDGNDRTKRARSFSDSGDSDGSSRSSTIASGSSSTEVSQLVSAGSDQRRPSTLSAPRNSSIRSPLSTHATSPDPPRLPTPEIQDVDMMPDYSVADGGQSSPRSSSQEFASSSSTSDQYRLSLARFNAFDHQISALRRSPPAERLPTLPPTLPPLALLQDQSRLSTSAIPFLNSPADEFSSLSERYHDFGRALSNPSQTSASNSNRRGNARDAIFDSTSSIGGTAIQRASRRPVLAPFSMLPRVSPPQASPGTFTRDSLASPHQSPSWPRSEDSPTLSSEEDDYSAFRQRLTSALDVLRSPSPLFPDIDNLRASSINPYAGPAASQRDDEAVSRHQESNTAQVDRTQIQSSVYRPINSSRSGARPRPALRRSSASREQYTAPVLPPHERPIPSNLHGDSVPPIFLQELEQWMNDESDDPIGVPVHWETLASTENESLSSSESRSRDELDTSESTPEERSQSDWSLAWNSIYPPSRRSSDTRTGLDDPSHSSHGTQSSSLAGEDTWFNAQGRVRGSDGDITGEHRRGDSDDSVSMPFPPAVAELWRGPYGSDGREDSSTHSLSQRLSEFRSRSDLGPVHGTSWSPNLLSNFADHPPTGPSSSSTHAARPSLASAPLLQRLRPRFTNRAGPPPPVVHEESGDSRRRSTRAEMLRRVLGQPNDELEEPNLGSRSPNATQSAQMLLFAPTLPPLLNRPPSPGQSSSQAFVRRRPSDLAFNRSAARLRNMHSRAGSGRDMMDEATSSLAEYYMDLSSELSSPVEEAPYSPTSNSLRRPQAATSNLSHRRSVSSGNLSYRPNDRLEGPGIRGEPIARQGFYDSQSSSISDMASTIANHSGHRRDGSDDSRTTSRSAGRGLFPSLAAEYRRAQTHLPSHQLDIPSLPSPDLGGPFTPPTQFIDSFSSESTGPSSISGNHFAHRSPSPARGAPPRTSGHTPYEPPPSAGSMHRNIDPNSFAPGPFRNTIQRVIERDRARQTNQASSHAPAIPPLAFAHSDLFPFRGSGTNNTQSTRREPETSTYLDHRHERGQPSPQYNPPSRTLPREPQSLGGFAERPHPLLRARPDRDASEPRRPPTDVHAYLMGHARLEGSRLEPLDHPSNRRGDAEGLSHAIDVLRQDGLSLQRSRQLINRFHRERSDAEAQPPSTVSWGDLVRNERPAPLRPHQWAGPAESSAAANSYQRHRPSLSSESLTRPHEHVHPRTRARLGRPRPDANSFFPPTGMFREYLGSIPSQGYNLLFGRPRALGDYVRDEDFDASYENLISIAATLGDAKPRATPDEVIARMDKGTFSQWTTPDSDQRCPICLDDYQPSDPLLRLPDCSHWLHQECLEQWLKGASTCPVCRKSVKDGAKSPNRPHHPLDDAGPSSSRTARFGNPPGGGRGGDSSRSYGYGA